MRKVREDSVQTRRVDRSWTIVAQTVCAAVILILSSTWLGSWETAGRNWVLVILLASSVGKLFRPIYWFYILADLNDVFGVSIMIIDYSNKDKKPNVFISESLSPRWRSFSVLYWPLGLYKVSEAHTSIPGGVEGVANTKRVSLICFLLVVVSRANHATSPSTPPQFPTTLMPMAQCPYSVKHVTGNFTDPKVMGMVQELVLSQTLESNDRLMK